MSSKQQPCPVCQSAATMLPQIAVERCEDVPPETPKGGAVLWVCTKCCGRFVLSIRDQNWLESDPKICVDHKNEEREQWINNRSKLKHLLSERYSQGLPTPWLQLQRAPYWPVDFDPRIEVAQIHIEDFLSNWPDSFAERLDRALCNLDRATHGPPGSPFKSSGFRNDNRLANILFAEHRYVPELYYVLDALESRDYITSTKPDNPLDPQSDASVVITPDGWERIEKINRGRRSPDKPAFVAMWFGDDTKTETIAFMDGVFKVIERAALRAGYRAARVDTEPHSQSENDFIMNKVLGMIRSAPFVIADLTGNRNGVYFEAGFARGLDIPVIQTCRESHFDHAHFDVRQIETKRWTEPADLEKQIYHHLLAKLGPGPYPFDDDE